MIVHFCIIFGCFHAMKVGLTTGKEIAWATKPKTFPSCPFIEKCSDPWVKAKDRGF